MPINSEFVIPREILLEVSPLGIEMFLDGLEYKDKFDPDVQINTYRILDTGEIALPRGLLDDPDFEDLWIAPEEDHRASGRALCLPKSKFVSREGQEETITTAVDALRSRVSHSGILKAGCGKGKTVMGIEALGRLGVSSCILVHQDYLGDQWEDAVNMLYPGASVGWVKGDRCDTGNEFDFVIASTQSITSKTRVYPEEFYQSFGALGLDEVHRYGAAQWQTAIRKFPSRFRIGFTATDWRGDGMWPVITDQVGKTCAVLDSDPIKTKVYAIEFKYEVDRDKLGWDYSWVTQVMKRAKIISWLAKHPKRNKALYDVALNCIRNGRKPIFISERREQLDLMSKWLERDGIGKEHHGFFVGGMGKTREKRKEEASKRVIFATFQKASEGLDIVDLDALILGTPQKDVFQVLGRLMRELEGKKIPIIVDPIDKGIEELNGISFARRKQYRDLRCEIVNL